MTKLYSDCGWLPFGLGRTEHDTAGMCPTGTRFEAGECVVDGAFGSCGEGTRAVDGVCTVDMAALPLASGYAMVPTGSDGRFAPISTMESMSAGALLTLCQQASAAVPGRVCDGLAGAAADPLFARLGALCEADGTEGCGFLMYTSAFETLAKVRWCDLNPAAEAYPAPSSGEASCAALRDALARARAAGCEGACHREAVEHVLLGDAA